MNCLDVDQKADEKVFHFLYAHILAYPEILSNLLLDIAPEWVNELRDYKVLLNNKNVDVEISCGEDFGVYFEFKTQFWKTSTAMTQLYNYEAWGRHKKVLGIIVIPREIAMDFVKKKGPVPDGRKIISMETINKYALGTVPTYLVECVEMALRCLPKWRVEPSQ